MSWKAVLEAYELLDGADVDGRQVGDLLRGYGVQDVRITEVESAGTGTHFVRAVVPGSNGRLSRGEAPTLGLIGRLGGIGARPDQIGFVSDGDGALVAIAAACKLGSMATRGDRLPGDVVISTHVCPNAPVIPHDPVPFMGAPVTMATMNRHEVHRDMEAILSLDTTKGNRIVNTEGVAISPTVKQGYILRVSEHLLDVLQRVSGRLPLVLPITTQDITPYGNGLYHINSIMQPATATDAPVVGVALTAQAAVAGSGTGSTDLRLVECATRFCIEVAKDYGSQKCRFYDESELGRLIEMYGDLSRFQEDVLPT